MIDWIVCVSFMLAQAGSPTNNMDWFMKLLLIFVTWSILGPGLETPHLSRDKYNVFINENQVIMFHIYFISFS